MADRRPYIAGNWKLWGTRAQASSYCERLLEQLPDARGPRRRRGPVRALHRARHRLSPREGTGIVVSAQNMHAQETGRFTGEVSAQMLLELGVDGVLLGHSERRQYDGETDRALQDKVPAALDAGLAPILCVGETEDEREAGDTERKLRHQVGEGLERVPDERIAEVTIAYEPIWAIGTGKVATPDQAQEAIGFVRALVGGRSEEAAQAVRMLVRRQRQAGQRGGAAGPARRGRRAGGRRQPGPRRVRRDRGGGRLTR